MKKLAAIFALAIFATAAPAFAAGSISPSEIYLDSGEPQGVFALTGGTNTLCFFSDSDGPVGCFGSLTSGVTFLGDLYSVASFGGPFEWTGPTDEQFISAVALDSPASTFNCAEVSQAACEALPEFSNTIAIHVTQTAPAGGAATIQPGDFTVPTTTPTDMLASVSAVVTDPGLLSVAVVAVALPLAFWVIHQLIGLLPKSRARRREKI